VRPSKTGTVRCAHPNEFHETIEIDVHLLGFPFPIIDPSIGAIPAHLLVALKPHPVNWLVPNVSPLSGLEKEGPKERPSVVGTARSSALPYLN